MKTLHFGRLLLLTIASLIISISAFSFAHAETDLTKEITDFGKGTLDIKTPKDITGTEIADIAVKNIIGAIPSLTVVNLVGQVRKEFGRHSEQGTNLGYSQCQRAANAKAWGTLGDIRDKGLLAPWAEISWNAVKGIASGGSTISELVIKHTKSKLSEMLKSWYNAGAPLPKEVYTLDHGGRCNQKSVSTWDPQHNLLTLELTGDCGCLKTRTGTGSIGLNNYKTTIKTKVRVSQVEVVEKGNKFAFWQSEKLKVFYKIGKLHVDTQAECQRFCPVDPPPEDTVGIFGRIFDWLFGKDDLVDPPEDQDLVDPVEDQKDDEKEGLVKPPEDKIEDDSNKDKKGDSKETVKPPQKEKELACGDTVSVDGRSGVPTFSYRETPAAGVNFDCDNSCTPNQVCKVLPASVGAFRESCVYCADIKKDLPNEEYNPENDNISEPPVACEIPSKQTWNNALMPGFKYTILDERRVLVENSGSFCGMASLDEFKKAAKDTVRFFKCPVVEVDNFKYTDIRAACSFIANF